MTGSTCNPDFNIVQVGGMTRWTPVKNLTFSADLVYSQLDQKYSGAIALPAITATPSRQQRTSSRTRSSVSLLLRAQRNW